MNFLGHRISSRWAFVLTFIGVFALTCLCSSARAADPYPPRVSHVEGTAAYVPTGKVDWEEVTANLPLLTGDRVFSHPAARLEIEFGEASFLRMGEETDVAFLRLDDRDRSLELYQGSIVLRLGQSSTFEIFANNARIEVKKKGLYRISAEPDGSLLVAVRKGRAEVESPNGKTKVKSAQYLWVDASRPQVQQVADAYNADDLDLWSDRRDARYIANQSVTYVGGTWYPGIYDLDYYGHWVHCPPYGNVWFPRVSVGWAPFRLGRWCHFSFGWTWVSYDPWGWLPYHYGRWIYYSPHRRWCWVPGGFHHWSPAMVHFYWGSGYVGWAPYGHTFVNNGTIIINKGHGHGGDPTRGLTVVRREDFGRGMRSLTGSENPTRDVVSRFRRGLPDELASPRLRAANRDPVRGRDLPGPGRTETVPGGTGENGRSNNRQALRGSDRTAPSVPSPTGVKGIDRILTRDRAQQSGSRDPVPERPNASDRPRDEGPVRIYQSPAPTPARPTSPGTPNRTIERPSPAPEQPGSRAPNRTLSPDKRNNLPGSRSDDRITTIPERSTLIPRTSRQLESRNSRSQDRSGSITESNPRTSSRSPGLSRSTTRSSIRSIFRSSGSSAVRSGRTTSSPSRSFARPSTPRSSSRPSASRSSGRSGRSGRSGKN